VCCLLGMGAGVPACASDRFSLPTAEELKMTSYPGYPGVAAVVLYREQITKDSDFSVMHYERIKILTDEGKKYANVEVGFVSTSMFSRFRNDRVKVTDIAGRTLHSDGTEVPFTGEAHEQTREEVKGVKVQVKVFTLPAVEVGSIIEYRYTTQSTGYDVPEWYVQGDLFVKEARYEWHRNSAPVVDSERRRLTTVSYYPLLPPGVQVQELKNQKDYQLTVKDVPPLVKEEDAPPVSSVLYRVRFSYTPYKTKEEFWQKEGKEWSKDEDKFIGGSTLAPQMIEVVKGATTDEARLRKIYAEIMRLENTYYTREHERREDKAEGGEVRNAADVLAHRRGSPTELTEVFIGMARSAGMAAYAMLVPDRSEHGFAEDWWNMSQFDDTIAIVTVDGKEQYFDPGSRYCPFGKLSWWHSGVGGLRQTADGTAIARTSDPDADNAVRRIAEMRLDTAGQATGKLVVTFTGAPALHLRHVALLGDENSLRSGLQKDAQAELTSVMEAKVLEVKDLENSEVPLTVTYDLSGKLGALTGRRMLTPVDLLEAGTDTFFPHAARSNPVYFDYPETIQDTIRLELPKSMTLEAQPDKVDLHYQTAGEYGLSVKAVGNVVEVVREYRFDKMTIPVAEYLELRAFYTQFQAKDHESLVLRTQPVAVGNLPGK
jgi:hypothetical protein